MGGMFSAIHKYASRVAFQPQRSSYRLNHDRLKKIPSSHNVSNSIAIMEYGNMSANGSAILYAHGNSCDIGNTDQFLQRLAQDTMCYIVSFDYPGYGLSDGLPSAKESISSIIDVHQYMLFEKKLLPSQIILYGTSLGTGPCCELASHYNVKGCLLQSPFTSAIAVGISAIDVCTTLSAQQTIKCSSSSIESPDFFVNLRAMKLIEAPIVILHGRHDTIVKYSHAKKLVAARESKEKPIRLMTLDTAGHNNIETDNYPAIVQSLQRLIHLERF